MHEHEYLPFDGLGLAQLVANKETTAAELLAIAQARADRVNPRINAIVNRLDGRAARQLRENLTGPYAGVPFLLADLGQDLAGTPTSAGCRALVGRAAAHTSTVVQQWLQAGLVVFGKTNTSEFGFKCVTEPELFGPPRNPWNPQRTPGGSSGGSAAAVAAGILPVAAASDSGGSIRIAAGCTGLVGLKAGRGLIPFGPKDNEPLNGLGTHGVISRSVRDTAAMLNVLAGPDDMAAFAPAVPAGSFPDDIERPPSQLRVGYIAHSAIRKSPHAQVTRAVENAARLLIDLGHEVEEVDPPHDDYQLARDFLTIWFVAQAAEIVRIKTETGVSDKSFELNTRLMAALGRRIDGMELQVAQERRRDHIAGLARLQAGYDLLMIPSIGEPPIKVGSLTCPPCRHCRRFAPDPRGAAVRVGPTQRATDSAQSGMDTLDQLANITGRPAISLPLYWTPDGIARLRVPPDCNAVT